MMINLRLRKKNWNMCQTAKKNSRFCHQDVIVYEEGITKNGLNHDISSQPHIYATASIVVSLIIACGVIFNRDLC